MKRTHSTDPSYTRPHPLVVDARIARMIVGAVAAVDPRQRTILRKLPPAPQVQQARSMLRQ